LETKNVEKALQRAIFVAGGEDSAILNSVEVFTEDEFGNYKSREILINAKDCSPFPALPKGTTSGTGAMFYNLTIVCLGNTGDDLSRPCYKFNADGSWETDFVWTEEPVTGVSSVVFNNWNGYDNAWWFLPNLEGSVVWAGQPPRTVPNDIERPNGANYPCVAMISEHEAFVHSRLVDWIFNILSNKWTPLPKSSERRNGPACGFLETQNGTRYIVLAGGYKSSTTEILNLESNEWVVGPDIGEDVFGGRMVSIPAWHGMSDNLLLVGGYDTKPLSAIKRLNLDTNSWDSAGNLLTPRFNSVTFSVPLQDLPTICT
jgi:hypothetical protein